MRARLAKNSARILSTAPIDKIELVKANILRAHADYDILNGERKKVGVKAATNRASGHIPLAFIDALNPNKAYREYQMESLLSRFNRDFRYVSVQSNTHDT